MRKLFQMILSISILFASFSPISLEAESSEQEVQIHVRDFGADNSGKYDSAKAIQEALKEAKKYEGKQTVRLVFEPGTYRITKENAEVREVHTSNTDSVRFPEKYIGFLIEDQKNLVVDGQHSQLIFEGNMMALAVMQSENIRVENLSWDFQIPSTSELTVFDFDEEALTIDYFVPSYFNYEITENGRGIQWQSEKDSEGNFYWTEMNAHRNYGVQIKYPTEMMGRSYHSHINPFAGVKNIEKLDNGLLRFHYHNAFPVKTVKGMNYQLLSNAERQTAGAFVFESKDVYFDQVRVSYLHGFGFLVQMAENVYFNRMRFETDIETGKNTSSFADGIHVSGAKGKIEITNSFFNNTHDDPINIHGTFTRAEELIDDHTVRLNYIHAQQGGFQQFHPGDKVIFYTRDTLESSDQEREYTVKSVKGPDKNNLKSMLVEFEEKLPSYLDEKIGREPRYVAENITYTPEILIKNNDFKNVFTRMILVTSRKKVVIEDNRFDAPTMPTLFFSNDSDEWYESGPIRDLVIRNNTFKVRSIGRTWWKYAPAIYFHPVTKGAQFPDAENPIHKNILIEGNTFYLESDGALRAESVENLRFINNKIYRLQPEIKLDLKLDSEMALGSQTQSVLDGDARSIEALKALPNGPEQNSGSVANVLEFQNSKDVVVEGNIYDDGLKKNVLIEGMDEKHYEIKDDLKVLKQRVDLPADDPIGDIHYVSSNPEVVSVDENGLVTAHKEGSAEVYAYTIWHDTLIKSNIETIHVKESAQKQALALKDYVYDLGEEATLTIRKEDGSVLDLEDYELKIDEENILTYEDGQFHIHDSGITKLRLENKTDYADIYVLVNDLSKQKVMNPKIEVEDRDKLFKIDEEGIQITRQGGQDLWGTSNRLSNLVKFDLSDYDKDHFSAEILLDGLPERKPVNSWDSAYFVLMREHDGRLDRDNYASLGKRAHADGIGMVFEENAQGKESNYDLGEDFSKMHFALEKKGEKLSFYYKEGEEYHFIQETDVSYLGDDFALAIATWGDSQANLDVHASDLKIVNGSIDELKKGEKMPLLVSDQRDADLSNVKIEKQSENKYKVEAENKASVSVIVWDQDKQSYLFKGDTFDLRSEGLHDVYVVNQIDSGKLSQAHHETLMQDAQDMVGHFLQNQKIVKDMDLFIPSDLNVLQYQKDNGPIQNIDIKDKDHLTFDEHSIQLKRLKSSEVRLEQIQVKGESLDLSQKDSFIYTESKADHLSFNVKASGKNIEILADNEDHQIDYSVDKEGNIQVPIYNGVVSVRIRAFAEDGFTHDMHTVHILRNTQYDYDQTKLSLNGQEIKEDFIDFENRYRIEDLKIETSPTAKASIHHHPRKEDRMIVRVEHDDKRSVEFLEFDLKNYEIIELDYSVLSAFIKKAEALPKEAYTSASYQALVSQLSLAKEILGKALSQEEIDQAVKDVQKAIEALEEKESVSTKALEAILSKAKALDQAMYTSESFETLSKAIEEAESVLENAQTQAEIDATVRNLEEALEALEKRESIKLNKEDLALLIEKAQELDAKQYTKDSYQRLSKALEKAETVMQEAKDQSSINKAFADLSEAIQSLEEIKTEVEPKDPIKVDPEKEKDEAGLSREEGNTVSEKDESTVQESEEKKDLETENSKLPATGKSHYLSYLAIAFILSGFGFWRWKERPITWKKK